MMSGATREAIITSNPICVVSIGAISAVGLDASSTAAAVRAGIAGFEAYPYMLNQQGEPYMLARVPSLEASLGGAERFLALCYPALLEALKPLQLLGLRSCKLMAIVALPEVRPGLPQDLETQLLKFIPAQGNRRYSIKGVETIFSGHSAGLTALQSARKHLASRACEFVLIGGIDSYLDPETLDWIEENDQLHTPSNAWGFIPGEAAAFSLICSLETAQKYQLHHQIRLCSISTAFEKNRMKTKTVCLGEGLTKAVRGTLSGLPSSAKIDFTICDQNGEAYRADEYGFMLCRLAENFSDPSNFLSPADCWGDVGAASAPLYLNLLIDAAKKGYSQGSYTLLWTSSEGGGRSAAIFQTIRQMQGGI